MRESFILPEDSEIKILPRMKEDEIEEEEIYAPFSESNYAEPTPTPLVQMGKARFHVSGLIHDESPDGKSEISCLRTGT